MCGASAPHAVGFGDAFEFVVVATVPSSDAESAELIADVQPFTVLDAEPMEREPNSDVTVIRLVRRLACLDEDCVGRARALRVVLPAPVIRSEIPGGREVAAKLLVDPRGRRRDSGGTETRTAKDGLCP